MVTLHFKSGTIEVRGLTQDHDALGASASWDARSRCFRAPAVAYADVVRALVAAKLEYDDQARNYEELQVHMQVRREPRPFQREAVQAWNAAKGRGVVVLPTGAGKSHVALMAIDAKRRSALAIAPTLDLVRQWYDLLRTTFASEVGVVGGGEHRVLPLTVATYDSAYLHMEHLGNRFGLVIFDECHHLPSESYAFAARASLAPYRLGLTATPERSDQREALFAELVGPVVYRKDIVDLSGEYLSDYETVRVAVELEPSEREEYSAERAIARSIPRFCANTASAWAPRGVGANSSCARRGAKRGSAP
jgi:superfamily II DNA or RNA helicase